MDKLKHSIFEKILISIILIASILTIHNFATASTYDTPSETSKTWGTTKPNMPANDVSGSTGMLPQYWPGTSARQVELEDARLTWLSDTKWRATIKGNIVYCAHKGWYVRYGMYDSKQHYLIPGGTSLQGVSLDVTEIPVGTTKGGILSAVRKIYERRLSSETYYTNPIYNPQRGPAKDTISITSTSDFPGGEEAIGYFIIGTIEGMQELKPYIYELRNGELVEAEADSMSNMNNLFDQLNPDRSVKSYSPDIDNSSRSPSAVSAIEGPEVIVIEQSNQANDGYAKTGASSYMNNQLAYIQTALENVYNEEIAQEYSIQDIQTAYWLALGQDPGAKGTEKGRLLYQYSIDYANFASQAGGGYKASINSSQAQVIADRNSGTYTVGPFWVEYPEYIEQDISYVKSLAVNDGQLIYDETHSDFKVVLETGGTSRPGANGLMKAYPKNREKFFIQFAASSIGNAESIDFSSQFEYISGTTMNYERIEAKANIYKYYGYCTVTNSDFRMSQGTFDVYIDYKKAKAPEQRCTDECHWVPGHYVDSDGDGDEDDWVDGYTEHHDIWVYQNEDAETENIHFTVFQPYIKMGEDPVATESAQPFDLTIEGERVYTVHSEKVTTPVNVPKHGPGTDKPINLTMELGGHVWVDEDGGKESISNGIDDGETRVPNVLVTLSDGQTTRTDSNGQYYFYGLDPMKQYSVTFTYNGQYYQPTTFAGSSTWGSSSWQTNSNAKDSQSERESFNLKFASIGSSPENYVGSARANKSYTKEELLNAGVIDEFGNLIGGSGSMAQYVRDCMMNAYTFDLYPYPSVFVIDDKPVTRDYNRIIGGNPPQLYDDAYYINLGLDERQDSDLAIKKDIDHVDLEINGQTHRYTYDTLEDKINADESWTIGVRVSDAYTKNYGTSYSRELYKSDYIYKASMYGEQAQELGKTKADELEIFVTYKVLIRNQALSIRARINEFVDYYDTDLEYIDERSYIEIKQSRQDAAQKGIYSVKASNTSRYSKNTETKIDGYDNLYITGLSSMVENENNNYLAAGQTAYVYLTFKVKKDSIDNEDWVRLDEEVVSGAAIGVGKENIVEINGYSTQYAKGTQVPNIGDVSFKPAGLVDRDSNPGNLNPTDVPKDGNIRYENFEDDTDKAPNIRIILYRDDETNRVIAGNVWEDARTESIEVTTTGDGIRSNNETLINGVTVQLVEIMENGKEYIWREFGAPATAIGQEIGGPNTTGKGTGTGTIASETPIINYKNLVSNYDFTNSHDGSYAFKSFMPGKYVVRFIYGDTVRTVTPKSLNAGGLNEKSYNGQDYKSTTYQEGIVQNRNYTWREASTWNLGQETKGRPLTEVTGLKPDASNNETVTLPQKDANGNFTYLPVENQKGYLYNITESEKYNGSNRNYPLVSDAKDIESRRNQVIDYSDNDVTNYIAEVLASHKSDYNTMNDRTQLLNDLMTNTKMTAETGLMVIELEYDREGTEDQTVGNTSSYKILNVDLGLEERANSALVLDKEITNVKLTLADGSILFDAKSTANNVLWRDHKAYSVGYKGNFLDESKFGSIQNIRNKNSNKFGLIQLTMDEELMHGATIEITYKVTVSNVGEVDYKDNLFYYTGNKSANAQVVTTRADQVIDYVANNLQFNASQNSNWRVIEKEDIRNQGLVNEKLKEQVDKYNTVIITDNLSKDLVPNLYKQKVDASRDDSVSVPLILTQLITSENDSDDLTYRNMVELVKTSNTVGRRMEYSVVGNQDPTEKPQELDSDISEIVRILPPFGNAGRPIIILLTTLAALVILTTGVILIKKKVLKK